MEQQNADLSILDGLNNVLNNGIPIDFHLKLTAQEKTQIVVFVLGIIAILVILKNQKLL
jgi:hypothetical protein